MSHPISSNMEYFNNMNRKNQIKSDEDMRDYFSQQHNQDSSSSENQWQSVFRRMSLNLQRIESFPKDLKTVDTEDRRFYYKADSMLSTLHQGDLDEAFEDDTLPDLEDIVQHGARESTTFTSGYFENPFESDGHTPYFQEEKIHPLSVELNSKFDVNKSSASHDVHEAHKHKHYLTEATESVKDSDLSEQLNHKKASTAHYATTRQPLAPYYPSAFAPAYLSLLCRDEYGRKAPPILFDALNISITDSIVDQSVSHKLWSFRIDIQYGDIKWTIHRTIIEFYNLHLTLKFKYISGFISEPLPSFPSQLAHLTNAALSSMHIARDHEEGLWRDVALKRRDALESYLRELIKRASMTTNYELCEFMELSALSIVKDMGWKGKEGYLEYRVGLPSLRLFKWQKWQKEWLILRDSYIAFCEDIASAVPKDVLLFDKNFKFTPVSKVFGAVQQMHLAISNGSRKIEIKVPTSRHMDEWIGMLNRVQAESPWMMNHRFGSFAPIRENTNAKWFIDGQDYFEAVAQAILTAKSDIFIEDWWLSPQLYLRRPPKGNEEYRLDRLLKRKACEGVMIYIVLYKNVSMALPLDSQHTQDWMQQVHPNIIVQRHSNLTLPFWAHHEKILVIDSKLAFIGGLDLCFGRYDTAQHALTDYPSNDENEIFPGQDYSNPRIKDFEKVSCYDKQLIDKQYMPRMPWHDVHVAMTGRSARDVARHFVQRWNFIKSNKEGIPLLLPKGEYVSPRDELKFKGTCRVQVLRSSAPWSQGIEREHSIYNAYMECIFKAKHFIYIENQFFITTADPENKLIKNKIGQAIVERIKRAHKDKQAFKVIVIIPVAPGFEGDFAQNNKQSMALRSVAEYQYRSISRSKYSIYEQLKKANIPVEEYISFYSLRNWGESKIGASKQSSELHSSSSHSSPEFAPLSNNSRSLNRKKARSRSLSQSKCLNEVGQLRQQLSSIPSDEPHNGSDSEKTNFMTEQIYIHSKLMIVDDRIAFCGSANLNDRSQLGKRDSEIVVVVEDTDMVDSRMNREPYKAAKFALTLRMQLFKEHLGLLSYGSSLYHLIKDDDLMDPLDPDFHHRVWNKIANRNTLIYREMFRCVPDDTVHSIEQHRQFVPDSNRVLPGHIAEPWKYTDEQVQFKLNQIQGHLVEFPVDYLKDVNLTASMMQEAVPPIVFT
ncbi:hypothetical protein BD560DRAFT_402302 [Blakeslea trispora]|nr:hypothetical protein BD560DRAFT_402302 [Blakeslea trispora]